MVRGEKMKVQIFKDEWDSFYHIAIYGNVCDVPKNKIEKWKKIQRQWERIQNEMEEFYNKGEKVK